MPIGQGKVSIQRKATQQRGWTVGRRSTFLEVLGQTCNVTMAAAAAGKTPRSARHLKKQDGEFARLWAEAMDDGAERLGEELLAQQLGQLSSGENPTGERTPEPAAPFDPVKAIAVLRARDGFGDRRRRTYKPATQAEIDEALMARLDVLAKQIARREANEATRAATHGIEGDVGGHAGGEDGGDGGGAGA